MSILKKKMFEVIERLNNHTDKLNAVAVCHVTGVVMARIKMVKVPVEKKVVSRLGSGVTWNPIMVEKVTFEDRFYTPGLEPKCDFIRADRWGGETFHKRQPSDFEVDAKGKPIKREPINGAGGNTAVKKKR